MGCITDKNGLVFLRENVGVSSARKVNELVLNYLNSLSKGIYKGILYGSFIIDENLSLKVIEFNARLGDPEAIPLVQNIDFSRLCENVENKTLCNLDFPIHKSSITSYIVPKNIQMQLMNLFIFH